MSISGPLCPRFPISLYGEEWNEWSYETEKQLAAATEFVQDTGPDYEAVDAEGYPVRLIVWNVELLVCHRVFETTVGGGPALGISTWHLSDGTEALVELHGGEPVRAVRRVGTEKRAVPEAWSSAIELPNPASSTPFDSAREFHGTWMRLRTGGRWL